MITRTTSIVNNKFQVTFDFQPDNIVHSRTNSKGTYKATHYANGTTKRQGIWEGIEIVDVQTKIGGNAWRSHGTSRFVTVETSDNNVEIQAWAKYRLKTMGWHWNDFTGTYPFFWFGNVSNVVTKYRKGYFTDSYPSPPGNEHSVCAVPADWKYVNCQWADWAYKHGQNTNNWAFDKGRYEQRNGNYESARENNGWISESNLKQMYRKSMMFNFEKIYTNSVVSSGIAVNPQTPELTVHYAKGDSGKVTLKHIDKAGVNGKLWLRAYCGDKQVDIDTYDSSGTFASGSSWTYNVDFNHYFGESYRARDVYYEGWTKNLLGYESPSTGRKGVHRYNGRPYVPTGLRIESPDGIIYNKITFKWDPASDPDEDSVVYDLWVRLTTKDGQVLKDDYIVRGLNSLQMDYDITHVPEESTIAIWVRSSDNLITSEWSPVVEGKKGAVPKGTLVMIVPCLSGNLYNTRPRFAFSGYDGESEFILSCNDIEYSTIKNPDLFTKSNDKVIFKPNFNLPIDKQFKCFAYMKNKYGNSRNTPIYKFIIKTPTENITEDDIIKALNVKNVQTLINDFGIAYNKKFEYTEAIKNNIVTAKIFNECVDFLSSINTFINDIIPNNIFDYEFKSKKVSSGDINDDMLWDNLIEEMKNI